MLFIDCKTPGGTVRDIWIYIVRDLPNVDYFADSARVQAVMGRVVALT